MAQLSESGSRSELPRRRARSHRVSPAWGQAAGRLARVSSLAVQAPAEMQAASWNAPRQKERPHRPWRAPAPQRAQGRGLLLVAEDPWGFPASPCGATWRGISWASGFQWQHRGWGERGAAEGQGLDAGAANPGFIRGVRRLLPRGRSLARGQPRLVGAAPSLGKGFQKRGHPHRPSRWKSPCAAAAAAARRRASLPARGGPSLSLCRGPGGPGVTAGSASKAGIALAGSAAPAPALAVCVTLRSKWKMFAKLPM